MLNWANCTPPAAEAVPEGVVFSQIGFAGYRLFRSIHCSSHFDWHLRTELETPDVAVWEVGGSCWGWTSLVSYCTRHRASRSSACLFHPALPCHPPAAARGHLLPQVRSPKTSSSCGFSGLWAQPFLLFLSIIPLEFHRNSQMMMSSNGERTTWLPEVPRKGDTFAQAWSQVPEPGRFKQSCTAKVKLLNILFPVPKFMR